MAARDRRVDAMRELCQEIETAIKRGEIPAAAAGDLKGTIDETRTRVWASLEAANSGEPGWVQEFWMRRAAEICQSMVERLEKGDLDPASPRARELHAAAEHLARALSGNR